MKNKNKKQPQPHNYEKEKKELDIKLDKVLDNIKSKTGKIINIVHRA